MSTWQQKLHYDGAVLENPAVFEWRNTLAQTVSGGIRPRIDAAYFGDGLPNVMDWYEWALEYEPADATAAMKIERLRTEGGVHTFVDWVRRPYTYTAASGQQFFYLPRRDAFALDLLNHTVQASYGAKVYKNEVEYLTAKIRYQATVAAGDSVTADEVWISKASVKHASGMIGAPFKIGTALALNDKIRVEMFCEFRVGVKDLPTKPFVTVGRADKAVYLTELA